MSSARARQRKSSASARRRAGASKRATILGTFAVLTAGMLLLALAGSVAGAIQDARAPSPAPTAASVNGERAPFAPASSALGRSQRAAVAAALALEGRERAAAALLTPATYTVQPNDSVWTIARKFAADDHQARELATLIAAANDLGPLSHPYIGQRLEIPRAHGGGG